MARQAIHYLVTMIVLCASMLVGLGLTNAIPGTARDTAQIVAFVAALAVAVVWHYSDTSARLFLTPQNEKKDSSRFEHHTASQTEKVVGKDHGILLEALTKRCPMCAEKINIEELQCRYCDNPFDGAEVSAQIRQVLSQRVDFSSTTKICPHCSEDIKLEARVCRHCRQEFSEEMVQIAKVVACRALFKVTG
jgi:hypothetical protein